MDPLERSLSDPSALTTAQLWREIAALKELLFTRQESTDKAIAVAHDDMVRWPTDLDKAVGTLRDLHEEKLKHLLTIISEHAALRTERFASIQRQFEDWDRRTDLALESQKQLAAQQNISAGQATAKSEASFTKQIESLGQLVHTKADAANAKSDDLKERMDRIEGKGAGIASSWGVLLGFIVLVGGLIAIFAAVK